MVTSIIIPTVKGRERFLSRLLDSLPDPESNMIERIIVNDEHLSLAAKRNKGAKKATGDLLLFIDDDNSLDPNALNNFSNAFYENVGILGFMACYDDNECYVSDGGSNRHLLSGFTTGLNTNKLHYKVRQDPYEVDEVANAFGIRKKLFWAVGGFDEKRFPIDLDEADLCKRVKDFGFKVMICPQALCYHASNTRSRIPDFRRTKNAFYMGRNRILFQRKHLSRRQYIVFLIVFLPVFVLSYCACLLIRRKPGMIYHFTKGVRHGLQNRTKNKY